MDKQFVLANIDEAIRLVIEQPEQLFDLNQYQLKRNCGTLYCTAGLLTTSAHFRNLGWDWSKHQLYPLIKGEVIDLSSAVDHQFGRSAYRLLFTSRGDSIYDTKVWHKSDKELALHRLTRHRQYVEAL